MERGGRDRRAALERGADHSARRAARAVGGKTDLAPPVRARHRGARRALRLGVEPDHGRRPGGTWPTFTNDTRWWAGGELRDRGRRGGAAAAARRHLRSRQRRRGSQSLPAGQRHVLADERALVRRRRELSADADDQLRRDAQSRFLQRRDRPADDRAARVPATAGRVPAVLRAGCRVHQRRRRARARRRRRHDRTRPRLLLAGRSVRSIAARRSRARSAIRASACSRSAATTRRRTTRSTIRPSATSTRCRTDRSSIGATASSRTTASPATTPRSKPGPRRATSGAEWSGSSTTRSKTAVGFRKVTPISRRFFVDVHKPNSKFNAGYLDVSPNYDPIDGFTANSDIRGPQGLRQLRSARRRPSRTSRSSSAAIGSSTSRARCIRPTRKSFSTPPSRTACRSTALGAAIGQLRSYAIPAGPGCTGPILYTSSFTGYPCYLDGTTQPFNLYQIPIGYRDGTPTPFDVNYSWGPFGDNYIHLFSTRRRAGRSPVA